MYKNKKIAIIFFARSNSKRLKDKLFKKIINKSILFHSINLSKKIKLVDERIMATTSKKRDNKIVNLTKKEKIKIFRGSEKNVLERMFLAYKSLKTQPDILIRFCCENPFYSHKIITKYVKKIINENLDLISVVKPSNLIFGASPVILTSQALKKIYNKAKNDVYKEHIETYCYDNRKLFKISYIKEKKEFFFPDTGLSIDTNTEYDRVKNIFKKSKIKNYSYNFKKIIYEHSKSKIFIKNEKLRKYLMTNYKNFSYSKSKKLANIIIDTNGKNFKNDNKLYLNFNKEKNYFLFSFVKNNHLYKLIQTKFISGINKTDHIKIFFDTLIKKTFFWPPLPLENLDKAHKNFKIKNQRHTNNRDSYFPREIISNKKIALKLNFIKVKIFNKNKFMEKIYDEKKKLNKERIFVYDGYFVYMNKQKLVRIKKFDFLKIVSIWRSHEYSI